MENLQQKAEFLKQGYAVVLNNLDANAPSKWGKMNAQQMIEHMADYVCIASGKTLIEVITPEERIPVMQGFLESEKQMRENTPNALLPDVPPPVRNATIAEAIKELQQELDHFFEVYEKDKERKIANPFFGHLSFDQQVQLLHKHGMHHLRQFGAVE